MNSQDTPDSTEPALAANHGSAVSPYEFLVVGDVHWDTIDVPGASPEDKIPGHALPLGHFDRPAGAWTYEHLLKHRFGEGKVISYGESMRSEGKFFSKEKWRREVTRIKKFPKNSKNDKIEVYRVEKTIGWIENIEHFRPENLSPNYMSKYSQGPNGPDYIKSYKLITEEYKKIIKATAERVTSSSPSPNIIVIADDARDFRYCCREGLQSLLGHNGNGPYVFIDMKKPTDGKDAFWDAELWDCINKSDALHRVIAVVSMSDLRASHIGIPNLITFEANADGIFEHTLKPPLSYLLKFGWVLIYDIDAVYYISNHSRMGNAAFPIDYYCKPFDSPPEYNSVRNGNMSGYAKILIISIIERLGKQLKLNFKTANNEEIGKSIHSGICYALRRWTILFEDGFGDKLDEYKQNAPESEDDIKKMRPYDKLFKKSNESKDKYDEFKKRLSGIDISWTKIERQSSSFSRLHWLCEAIGGRTIHSSGLKNDFKIKEAFNTDGDTNKYIDELLLRVVEYGASKAVKWYGLKRPRRTLCPVTMFGRFAGVWREEIEGYVDIYKLVQKYLDHGSWKKPLSIAVFGPPGTGKSTAIKQIVEVARAASGSNAGQSLEFNVAQFTDPEQLTHAFHESQDRALAGEVPLVFFDEFDSKLGENELGWLKYFLQPMQDGTFKDANSTKSYLIGRSIIAFAGGTSKTFQEFQEIAERDKGAKGPDFISRLRGHIDIKGINLVNAPGADEIVRKFRRAILLHSMLKEHAPEIFDQDEKARIDEKLALAFVKTEEYRHDLRSLQAILQMSRTEDGELRIASLPTQSQLNMHVKADDFLRLAGVE